MQIKTYRLFKTTAAIEHIKDITTWYNKEKKGLGKRFKDNLKAELQQVKKNPFARATRYDDIRFAIPDKFPYAAHYTIEENTIIIHAVFAFKQDPEENWIK